MFNSSLKSSRPNLHRMALEKLLDCLVRLNLSIRFARRQGYDGAAVMCGVRKGVAANTAAVEPRAVYMC